MCEICGMTRNAPTSAGAMLAALGSVPAAGSAVSASAAPARAPQSVPAGMPEGLGQPGRRLLIRGGAVMSMDEAVGNFATGDVLIEGARILEVAARIDAPDAAVIDAAGMVVMPGFVDTHHHQFETALRGVLSDGILMSDGRPESVLNYYETMLQTFSMVYRPQDVYINELFGGISQLDAGVTTVMDVSQIHHSPEHSDAAIEGLRDAGRRAVFGYFEGWGDKAQYPGDARRLRDAHFTSDDQLLTMVMGGEIYIPGWEQAWAIGRELGLRVALHVVGTFGMRPTFDEIAQSGQFGADNIFIHMTGMSDEAWAKAAGAGAHVSLSVPIEMQMRHGTPPIQKALDLGMEFSLSSDVECTMSADPFTQMRSAMTLQRMFANEKALAGEDYPRLLQPVDVLRAATIGGARGLGLDARTGSLTPGKDADIVLLDANAVNVAPLNHVPGAVVGLMERSNVDCVLVAGQVRKWRGALVGVDVARLRAGIEASRDYIFEAAKIPQDRFRT